MRIIVFSDSHRHTDACIQVLDSIKDADMVIHAGDGARDAEELSYIYDDMEFVIVAGNNDIYSDFSDERLIEAAGMKIFITHGHYYNVRQTHGRLAEKAKQLGADLVIYGHTHRSFDGAENGVHLLNPGSCGYYPRSYGVVEIDDGVLRSSIIPID